VEDIRVRFFLKTKGWTHTELWRDPETGEVHSLEEAERIARERDHQKWNSSVDNLLSENKRVKEKDAKLRVQRGKNLRTPRRADLDRLS
jgi:hypothetical protein